MRGDAYVRSDACSPLQGYPVKRGGQAGGLGYPPAVRVSVPLNVRISVQGTGSVRVFVFRREYDL